jgi:hypothetical protein
VFVCFPSDKMKKIRKRRSNNPLLKRTVPRVRLRVSHTRLLPTLGGVTSLTVADILETFGPIGFCLLVALGLLTSV